MKFNIIRDALVDAINTQDGKTRKAIIDAVESVTNTVDEYATGFLANADEYLVEVIGQLADFSLDIKDPRENKPPEPKANVTADYKTFEQIMKDVWDNNTDSVVEDTPPASESAGTDNTLLTSIVSIVEEGLKQIGYGSKCSSEERAQYYKEDPDLAWEHVNFIVTKLQERTDNW